MLRALSTFSITLAALLVAQVSDALAPGDAVVADTRSGLVSVDAVTGVHALLPSPATGTGEVVRSVGIARTRTRAAVVVAPVPNVPLSEVHIGVSDALDAPSLVITVPDKLEDIEGTTQGNLWYAVGDHLWALHELTTPSGSIGVARRLAEVAEPFRRGTGLQLYEADDGGGGKTVSRILIAAGSDGVLLWNAASGTLAPFGGSPASPTPPNDIVWSVADADDSLLGFGTTQLEFTGSSCTDASGLYLFALFGFGPAVTDDPLLRCGLGLAFVTPGLGYVTALDDLLVGGNARVVRVTSSGGTWNASTLASGPPLWTPLDLEIAPEPIVDPEPEPICFRSFVVVDPADAPDVTPGDGLCASASGACTLRAAVMELNAVGGRACITLLAGTFELTIEGHDDEGAVGDLDLRESVVISGAGRDATIVDANQIDRVFDVPEGGAFSVVLQDLTVRDGFAVEGGAVQFLSGGVLALDRVALRDNLADLGTTGGVSVGAGAATIRRSTVTGGEAFEASAVQAYGPLVVEDSTFAGPFDGDAVVQTFFAPAAFVRTTFEGGSTGRQDCASRSLDDATFHNVTFSGTRRGRAVCAHGSGNRVTLWNVTIANHAESPVFASAPTASIAALHTAIAATSDGGDACDAPLISLGGNVDGDGSCVGAGSGDRPASPLHLGPLANNGGPTRTHAPRAGSALIDAGRSTACPARDQRGIPRPFDGDGDAVARCDVGAVELAPEPAELPFAALVTLVLFAAARSGLRRAHGFT